MLNQNHVKKGKCHPPQKSNEIKTHIKIILLYSAKKNKANPIAEYSTLYPETNSASASGKSKGCLLVSAKIEIKNKRKIGNNGIQNHILFCNKTILLKLRLPAKITIFKSATPIAISYETICAAERNDPKKAYLELLDHPAITTECTANEEITKRYKTLKLKSTIEILFSKGITTQLAKAKVKLKIGAIIKIIKFELFGKILSFNKSLSPSAIACKSPKKPITVGPVLRCIYPKVCRSKTVKKATEINTKIIILKKYTIFFKKNIQI